MDNTFETISLFATAFEKDGKTVVMNPITKEIVIVPYGTKEKQFICNAKNLVSMKRNLKEYAKFEDTYGAKVKIKESSDVYKRCWIFVEGGEIDNNDGQIHIDENMARTIIKGLEIFISDNR